MQDTVRDILDDLLKFYEKKITPAQRSFYEKNLDRLDQDILCAAILELKRQESPNRLPTLAVIQKYYHDEKDRIWQKTKNQGVSKLSDLNCANPETVVNFNKLMSQIGKIPKDEWLALGMQLKIFTEKDCEDLRLSWKWMGADEKNWKPREWWID